MYAETYGPRGNVWYVLYADRPDETGSVKNGPYRDKTDAENAAEDMARTMKVELVWRN